MRCCSLLGAAYPCPDGVSYIETRTCAIPLRETIKTFVTSLLLPKNQGHSMLSISRARREIGIGDKLL